MMIVIVAQPHSRPTSQKAFSLDHIVIQADFFPHGTRERALASMAFECKQLHALPVSVLERIQSCIAKEIEGTRIKDSKGD